MIRVTCSFWGDFKCPSRLVYKLPWHIVCMKVVPLLLAPMRVLLRVTIYPTGLHLNQPCHHPPLCHQTIPILRQYHNQPWHLAPMNIVPRVICSNLGDIQYYVRHLSN